MFELVDALIDDFRTENKAFSFNGPSLCNKTPEAINVMHCAIWYHLYNLKNIKNTHGGVLILVKLQAKINTPSWVFFTFFKLYKWYQIAQRTTNIAFKVNTLNPFESIIGLFLYPLKT